MSSSSLASKPQRQREIHFGEYSMMMMVVVRGGGGDDDDCDNDDDDDNDSQISVAPYGCNLRGAPGILFYLILTQAYDMY